MDPNIGQYYWELVQFDGTVTPIPPTAVKMVKRRWDNGDPIHTSAGSVPASTIKSFRQTDKLFNSQPLIEDVARAFNEPIIEKRVGANGIEEEVVIVRWVKKNVTQDRYNRYYSNIPGYKSLGEENGMVVMAFRQPIHQINHELQQECTESEVEKLTHN